MYEECPTISHQMANKNPPFPRSHGWSSFLDNDFSLNIAIQLPCKGCISTYSISQYISSWYHLFPTISSSSQNFPTNFAMISPTYPPHQVKPISWPQGDLLLLHFHVNLLNTKAGRILEPDRTQDSHGVFTIFREFKRFIIGFQFIGNNEPNKTPWEFWCWNAFFPRQLSSVPKNSNVKGWSHPEKKKRPGLADRRPTSENPNQILWDNTAWTNWKRTTHHTCVSVYLYI